ncbi:MAG: FG-GAP-like repeat-containing protein, partial [Candidatus Nanopelagicales bacterium]
SNYPTAIALKDFDADGNIDIGVSDYYEKFTVMLGLGDGTFDPEPIVTSTSGFSPDYPTQSIGVGDVNGDGKPDIVTSVKHMYGTVLINAGDGTFTPTQALDGALTGDSYGSVLSDVDGDGDLDMLRTQSDFKVYAAHNDGTGTFADFVAVGDASPDGSMGLAQADFNGDGIDDLTLGSSQFAVVSALSGDADGTFGTFTAPVSSPMIGTLAVAAADMNGDGKPDIVTGGNSSNYVGVLLNTSDFPAPAITAVSPSTGTAAGGTTVELTGSGFSDVTDVKVGGKSVPFTINGPGKITIQMPAGSPGSVDIVVTSPFGEGSAKFTYTSDGPAFTKPVTIEAGPVKGKGTKRHVSLNGTTRKAQKKVYVYRASTRNGPAKLIKVTNSRKHLWKIGRASLGGKSSAFFCARVGSHFSNTVRVPNRAKTITYAVRGDIVRCK